MPDFMSWTIRVVPADYDVGGALPFVEPTGKKGVAGEDVSGVIDLIGACNKRSGFASDRRDNLWGFADYSMKLAIPLQFDSVSSDDNHPPLKVSIEKDRSGWYLLDKTGNYVI